MTTNWRVVDSPHIWRRTKLWYDRLNPILLLVNFHDPIACISLTISSIQFLALESNTNQKIN